MNDHTRVLIIEDLPTDAELGEREVRGVIPKSEFLCVETREDFVAALNSFRPDIILSDYKLPQFDGLTALKLTLEHAPETPFIIFTGSMNEDTAVECMKAGAWDYVIKERIKRLGPAVRAALEQYRLQQEHRQIEERLRATMERHSVTLKAVGDGIISVGAGGRLELLNPAAEALTGWSQTEAAGRPLTEVFSIVTEEAQDKIQPPVTRVLDYVTSMNSTTYSFLIAKDGTQRPISYTGSSIHDDKGAITGMVLVFRDVSEEHLARKLMQVRLALLDYAVNHSLDELLTKAIDEAASLVDSPIGFYHFVEPDQKALSLQQWSTRTLKEFCRAEGKGKHYAIDQAGVWADCVYAKEPVIHNDYPSLSHKKGMPEGHAELIRELVAPVVRNEKVAAILGVGNKPTDYTQKDVDIVAYLADVTWEIVRRKRADETLRKSEEKYRLLVDNAGEAIYVAQDGRLRFANPKAQEIFGYPVEFLTSNPMIDFIHPDDRALITERYQQRVKGLDPPSNYEFRIIRNNQEVGWVELKTVLIEWEGKPATLNFTSDVTARRRAEEALRESEEKYRLLVESTGDIVFMHDKNGMITYANQKGLAFSNYTHDEVLGKNILDFLPEDELESLLTRRKKRLSGDTTSYQYETSFLNQYGARMEVDIHSSPIFKNDELIGVIIVARDITYRKRAEEQKQKLELQLEQARKLEAVGQLAAGIAHEINTPIQYVGDNTRFLKDVFTDLFTLIEGYGELTRLVENSLPTEDAIRRIKTALEEHDLDYLRDDIPIAIDQTLEGVDRISTIVQSMRQFAPSDRGSKLPVDLHKMIESTAIVAKNEYKYIADLKMDFDTSLPLVPCCAGEFNQVVLNLVINATHAIADRLGSDSQEKGLITIRTQNTGEWVQIRIEDTGGGIPPDIQPRVFDPFFTTKEVGKGTGQGLAIAHSIIVEKHNGKLWFETQEGRGTTFIIQLPVQ